MPSIIFTPVSPRAVAPGSAAAAPPAIPVGPAAVPLQRMSDAQLRAGLRITVVDGSKPDPTKPPTNQPTKPPVEAPAGSKAWGDLAVARMVQDAADFMAQTAGVGPSLKTVTINDAKVDKQAWAGYAIFDGPNNGTFHLSTMTTKDIAKGLVHLQQQPLSAWSATDLTAFTSANETILHEAAHITLPKYDQKTIDDFYRDPRRRGTEEALTEITAAGRLSDFMRSRYGQDVPAAPIEILHDTSIYTRFVQRTRELFGMAGVRDERLVTDTAQLLGDATQPAKRFPNLAQEIAAKASGGKAPRDLVRRLQRQLPRFVEERPATGVRTMLAAMRDLRDGRPVDMPALNARLDETERIGRNADRRDGWPGK